MKEWKGNVFDRFAETGIDMLVSILEIKSMDLGSITLLMVTVTRGHGMKAVSKAKACIPSKTVMQDAVNGTVGTSRLPCPH